MEEFSFVVVEADVVPTPLPEAVIAPPDTKGIRLLTSDDHPRCLLQFLGLFAANDDAEALSSSSENAAVN